MINILLSGCSGRIGKKINKINNKNFILKKKLNKKNKNKIKYFVKKVDLIIDFSIPKNTIKLIYYCLKYKKKIIIGTTGFNSKELMFIKDSSKYITVFFDYNFNLGFLNYLKIVKFSNFILKNMKTILLETHRIKKLDKPSGSSYKIMSFINRHFKVISKRIGNEKGTHEIIFHNKLEMFSFKHKIFKIDCILLSINKIIEKIKKKSKGLYVLQNIS
ncbi:dihydrodipicolinate reductase C-terminal domain-containing protein [Candidatus Vidania fulgoroideorum]